MWTKPKVKVPVYHKSNHMCGFSAIYAVLCAWLCMIFIFCCKCAYCMSAQYRNSPLKTQYILWSLSCSCSSTYFTLFQWMSVQLCTWRDGYVRPCWDYEFHSGLCMVSPCLMDYVCQPDSKALVCRCSLTRPVQRLNLELCVQLLTLQNHLK